MFKCDVCGKMYNRLPYLKRHMIQHRDNKSVTSSNTENVVPPSDYVCRLCDKHFPKKGNLKLHMVRRHGLPHFGEDGSGISDGTGLGSSTVVAEQSQDEGGAVGGASGNDTSGDQNVGAGVPPTPQSTGTSSPDVQSSDKVAGDQGVGQNKLYILRKVNEQFSKKFQLGHTIYIFRLNIIQKFTTMREVLETLFSVFEQLVQELTGKFNPNDLIRITFDSRDIDYPVYIHFNQVSNLSARDILTEIDRVLQSFSVFNLNHDVIISVTHVKIPTGSGRDFVSYLFKKKRCVVYISNTDKSCAARALVLGKVLADNMGDKLSPDFVSMCNDLSQQTVLAKELCMNSGVTFDTPVSLLDFDTLCSPLFGYRIIIVSHNHLNSIVYDNQLVSEKIISLYHKDNHYDLLTSLPAFFGRAHFCYKCYSSTNSYFQHACKYICKLCRHSHTVNQDDDDAVEWIHCTACNRSFKGTVCFNLHKLKLKTKIKKKVKLRKSVCQTFFKCSVCKLFLKRKDSKRVKNGLSKIHVCYMEKCRVCNVEYSVLKNHVCYIQKAKGVHSGKIVNNNNTVSKYIFFDIECCQDTGQHTPILCVAERVCQVCIKSGEAEKPFNVHSKCPNCGVQQHVFYGEDCIKRFCKWLITEEHKNCRVLCHNYRGYDSYFILNHIYSLGIKPDIIYNGGKVMSLKLPKYDIRFIDSLNFMPMALSKIPSTFNITELRKGYFPHLYNTLGNQSVDTKNLPPPFYYIPGSMSPSENVKFNEWYKKNFMSGFNMRREMISYCISDVHILRRGCLKFRDIFMQISGEEKIDPFTGCLTIASACNLLYRTMFLKEDTIPIVAHTQPLDNHSVLSMEWLIYIERKNGIKLRHARSSKGEYRVKGAKVDGYHAPTRTVYQFHGCYIHGHADCYPSSLYNRFLRKGMGTLYSNTLRRDNDILLNGNKLITMWSCEFEKIKKEKSYKQLMGDLDIVSPLQPRDAFYGGRVDTMYTYYKAKPDEVIEYYDFTSLYPYINKYSKYPLGVHYVIPAEKWKDKTDITGVEGLIKCTVLPPKKLYHPVLPVRHEDKLYFPLCRTCVVVSDKIYNSTSSKEDYFTAFYGFFNGEKCRCIHTDKERALTGTWVSDELQEAVNVGYKILKVHESWCFERVSQYNEKDMKGGLFTEYINMFLKIKQEKSGWPEWVKTDQDRIQYVENYYKKEGIRLDPESIEVNPGLRAVAKLMLNSFWGKFGQRQDLIKSKYFTNPAEYFKMLNDKRINVCNIQLVNDDMVYVEYREKTEFVQLNPKINVIVAAYTTAHARLKLYSLLKPLGDRVLYCDTDSIIFWSKKAPNERQYRPVLGYFLGELTSELPYRMYILEFASTGPKSYAFVIVDENGKIRQMVCKVKGLCLDHSVSQHINFECIKDMVLSELRARKECEVTTPLTKTVANNHFITRDKKSVQIRTIEYFKTFQCVYSKRFVLFDGATVPFGY